MSAATEALRVLARLLVDLDAIGFDDPDGDVSGADAVNVINDHIERIRNVLQET